MAAGRSSSYEALILRAKDVPSGARVISLLSAEHGLADAFVFGGGKSKLRSLASPWHYGRAWVYTSATGNDGVPLVKLNDFDPLQEYAALRSNLETIQASACISEFTLLTSSFGGEWESGLALCLDALAVFNEAAPDNKSALTQRALCLFVLRALSLMGLCPDENAQDFSALPAGALAWINAARGKTFASAAHTGLAHEAQAALRGTCVLLAHKTAGTVLKTFHALTE